MGLYLGCRLARFNTLLADDAVRKATETEENDLQHLQGGGGGGEGGGREA